jgi:hypothetical protein
MRARTIASLAIVPVLVAVGVAVFMATTARPAAATGPGPILQLVQAYFGTARYQDVDRAVKAGYGEFKDAAGIACIDLPGAGGMGTHYVSSGVGDTDLNPATPEALVYETQPNGRLRLVAVEYIVFREPWDLTHNAPPSLFGQQFKLIPGPEENRYGIPDFYELHAWIWKWNPRGLFDDWNSRVTCEFAAG